MKKMLPYIKVITVNLHILRTDLGLGNFPTLLAPGAELQVTDGMENIEGTK